MLGSDGSVVTAPCHVPERLLSRLKDFRASVGAGLSAGLFASDCAKARVASDIRTRGRRKRTDFMFGSPLHVVGRAPVLHRISIASAHDVFKDTNTALWDIATLGAGRA